MEHTSDTVSLGKLLHESTYKNTEELTIDRIAIDFIEQGDGLLLHEVKKSKKMESAHIYQLLYYIFDLNLKGITARGIINYPQLRRKYPVELTPENQKEIEEILKNIGEIIQLKNPPKPEKKPYCRTCSYYELCWVM
jgi:CRISPR-associated exonuclease Cas4